MSVTFSIAGVPSLITVPHPADCDGRDGECGAYGCHEYVDGPGVNVSNANAHSVLAALGIEGDFEYGIYGTMTVEDFLGHVLAAEATYGEDTGFAPMEDNTPGQARFIDCGRPAGYMNGRLAELRDLCEQARSMGATEITWG